MVISDFLFMPDFTSKGHDIIFHNYCFVCVFGRKVNFARKDDRKL